MRRWACANSNQPLDLGNRKGYQSLMNLTDSARPKERQIVIQKDRSAVSLNVKDPEAHRLAQAIAQATGETITRAVTEALRERYERLQERDPEALAADIRAIAERAAPTSSVPIWITLISFTTS